jgi:signal transduction histidine kinase
MSRTLDTLHSAANLSRKLLGLAVVAVFTAGTLVYLLQLTLEEMHRAQMANAKDQYRAALSRELALFEHKLTAKLDCTSTKCAGDWSSQMAEEFPWSGTASRELDDGASVSALAQQSLSDNIKSLTIRERITLYANPVYVPSDKALNGGGKLIVYVRDPDDRRYLRSVEINLEKLLGHLSVALAAEGVFIDAGLADDQHLNHHKITERLELPVLGIEVAVDSPGSAAERSSAAWLSWLVSALAALLVVSIWLVISETKRRRAAEAISREYEERAQAGAKLATLGEIASMLSHELNQPLAAIESFASAATNLAARHATDPQLDKCLEQIRSQVRRADMIIRSVHGFLKHKPSDLQSFNLCEAIADLMPLLEIQAQRAGANLNLLLPDQLWIIANKTMVEQVILNLARNGLEAMNNESDSAKVLTIAISKKLGTRSTPEQIAANPLVGSPHVEISVSDRGAGISPDVREKVFMPFVSTKDDGAGIGLSLCKSVAERHKGHISFRDNPAGGTTFTLILPEHPSNVALEV